MLDWIILTIMCLCFLIYAVMRAVPGATPAKFFVGGASNKSAATKFLHSEYMDRKSAADNINLPDTAKWNDAIKSYIHNSNYNNPKFFYNLIWSSLDITNYSARENEPAIKMEDLPSNIPYVSGTVLAKVGAHVGQRKLFLNELYFVSRRISPQDRAIVVYAGSAPANKGAFLAAMTPNITWIFVDPAEFNIIRKDFDASIKYVYPKKGIDDPREQALNRDIAHRCANEIYADPQQINIINAYMTSTLADALANVFGRDTMYFISDIRTNMFVEEVNGKKRQPDTADITTNNAWQYNWIRIMKPKYSMLKFRHPFYAENPAALEKAADANKDEYALAASEVNGVAGIDFLANARAKRLVYFGGDQYIQPWAPVTSTEIRLETDGKTSIEYSAAQHDSRLFVYNAVYRNLRFTKNPNADLSMGFDHCNDCAYENVVWTEWLKTYADTIAAHNNGRPRYALPDTVGKCVAELTKSIGNRSLIMKDPASPDFIFHGKFGEKLTVDRFTRLLKYYHTAYKQ